MTVSISIMQKRINFTKMHGLGNDFIVIDAIHQSFDAKKLSVIHLADRHIGIGFDQLLMIEPSKQADFYCRIFNADGSEAEQCGNGLRCVARFLQEKKLNVNSFFSIETKAGIFPVQINDYDHICVTMGAPHVQEKLLELQLHSNPNTIIASVLSLGNPHTIIKVDAVDTVHMEKWGTEISQHAFFPNGTNVGFMEVLNRHHIRLRTFERGVGETLACGSNACAAICTGIINGWLQHKVTVEFRYGSLSIEWDGENTPIRMIGPASHVFDGEINML